MAISTGKTSRSNVLAGVFVIACILLGVAVTIVLSNIGERLKPTSTYVVRFSVFDGAEGLDRGAPVKLGGQRIGRVLSVGLVNDEVTGEPAHVDVVIQVARSLRIFSDADVQLIRPLLGTGSSINIVSLTGGGVAAAPTVDTAAEIGPPLPLDPGDMIRGRLGAPGFLAPSDYAKFQSILARVDRITASAEPRIDVIMADAEASVKSVRSIASAAEKDYAAWSPGVADVIARARAASEQFEPIAARVREGVDEVNKRAVEARAVIEEARLLLETNRPKIDAAITDAQELMRKANTDAYERVVKALDAANAGLDHFASVARQTDELVAAKSPELSELVTDAALAANQLKLATVEIRAAPWRLLYQPTKKELENELLYNSVRQYSAAVSELRRTADALAIASQRPGADRAALDDLAGRLREAFDAYQEQERAFLQRWVNTPR
jgi:ABC-type transporter Mla subunit MlaD